MKSEWKPLFIFFNFRGTFWAEENPGSVNEFIKKIENQISISCFLYYLELSNIELFIIKEMSESFLFELLIVIEELQLNSKNFRKV